MNKKMFLIGIGKILLSLFLIWASTQMIEIEGALTIFAITVAGIILLFLGVNRLFLFIKKRN